METLRIVPENIASSKFQMNSVSATFKSKIRSFTLQTRFFCSCSSDLIVPVDKRSNGNRDRNGKGTIKAIETQLRDNWLASLSFPLPDNSFENKEVSKLVIGIDPDVSGAVAVLRDDSDGCSAQVFDTPHLQMLVGKRVRKRLDAKSMVHLLRSFEAPIGTIAYLEQSVPFPKDGKQGWWSGGFGYGLWIGVLVASGFSVIPIPSLLWKNKFELSGGHLCKDDSRRVATELFPSLESLLRRKKDHGRAEALLIAAYGRGLQKKTDPKDEADLSLMSSTQDHLLQPVSLVSLC